MDCRTIKCLAVNPGLPAEPRLDFSHRQMPWSQDGDFFLLVLEVEEAGLRVSRGGVALS